MDLRFGDSKPTDEERAAVDALLGPPRVGLGGRHDRTTPTCAGPAAGATARERRDLLLPGLHAVNDRVGWISEGALDYLCRRLTVPPAEAYGVATFYAMFSVEPRARRRVVHVCTDLACAAARGRPGGAVRRGSLEASARRRTGSRALSGPVRAGPAALPRACASGAAGRRSAARGRATRRRVRDAVVAPATADAVSPTARAPDRDAPRSPPPALAVPQAGRAGLMLLRRVGVVDPATLDDYRAHGGYTRAAPGLRARPGRGDPRGHRLRAGRPRRRRLPHRPQVAGHGAPARPAALPGLQRRRVRAGHLQGPGAHGGRPVRADRGDDDRRRTPPARTRATSTCGASTRARCAG